TARKESKSKSEGFKNVKEFGRETADNAILGHTSSGLEDIQETKDEILTKKSADKIDKEKTKLKSLKIEEKNETGKVSNQHGTAASKVAAAPMKPDSETKKMMEADSNAKDEKENNAGDGTAAKKTHPLSLLAKEAKKLVKKSASKSKKNASKEVGKPKKGVVGKFAKEVALAAATTAAVGVASAGAGYLTGRMLNHLKDEAGGGQEEGGDEEEEQEEDEGDGAVEGGEGEEDNENEEDEEKENPSSQCIKVESQQQSSGASSANSGGTAKERTAGEEGTAKSDTEAAKEQQTKRPETQID
uniref:Uncharacterized protein n=2 Tax=Parascaris univalens TaxID=6257 RepID=A0A915A183_PARUN